MTIDILNVIAAIAELLDNAVDEVYLEVQYFMYNILILSILLEIWYLLNWSLSPICL